MNLALTRIKAFLPDFNERRFASTDFYSVCEKRNCEVYEIELENEGYYLTNGRSDYIFLDYRLKEFLWLEAAFHEMIHLLLHYPCDFLLQKQQNEARSCALIAMMPKKDLPEMIKSYEQLEPVLQFLLEKRLQVLSVTSY